MKLFVYVCLVQPVWFWWESWCSCCLTCTTERFSYISLIYSLHRWGCLHCRCLKRLVIKGWWIDSTAKTKIHPKGSRKKTQWKGYPSGKKFVSHLRKRKSSDSKKIFLAKKCWFLARTIDWPVFELSRIPNRIRGTGYIYHTLHLPLKPKHSCRKIYRLSHGSCGIFSLLNVILALAPSLGLLTRWPWVNIPVPWMLWEWFFLTMFFLGVLVKACEKLMCFLKVLFATYSTWFNSWPGIDGPWGHTDPSFGDREWRSGHVNSPSSRSLGELRGLDYLEGHLRTSSK